MKNFTIFILALFSVFSCAEINAQDIYWASVADIPSARRNHSVCALDTLVYLTGGYDNNISPKKNVYCYNETSNTWIEKTPMSRARSNFGFVSNDSNLFVIGGDPFRSSIEKYNPILDEWQDMTDMPTGRQHIKCVCVGDEIYAISGLETGWNYSDLNEVYSISNDSWTTKSPIPDPRDLYGIAAYDNKIYVFGGVADTYLSDLTSCYDIASDTWTTVAPMPENRFAMGVTVYNDKIYIIGGGDNSGSSVSSVMVYDPITDSWIYANSLETSRKLTDATMFNDKLIVVGGCTTSFLPFASCEIGSFIPASIDENTCIEDLELIFTNYNDGSLTVNLDSKFSDTYNLKIINVAGQLQYQEAGVSLIKGNHDLKRNINLNVGIYFIVLESKYKRYTKVFSII